MKIFNTLELFDKSVITHARDKRPTSEKGKERKGKERKGKRGQDNTLQKVFLNQAFSDNTAYITKTATESNVFNMLLIMHYLFVCLRNSRIRGLTGN